MASAWLGRISELAKLGAVAKGVIRRARARARPRARYAERKDWATGFLLRAVGRQGIHLAGFYGANPRAEIEHETRTIMCHYGARSKKPF